MIKILEFKKNMQIDIKNFVIQNMKSDLNVDEDSTFIKITNDLDNIEDNYIKQGGVFLTAYDYNAKQIVGTIALKYENGIAILKRFYVLKEIRKRKIGFLLYKTLEKIIKEKNIKNVYLVSGKELKYAHKFYKRNGWMEEKNNPGIYVRENAILYKKDFELEMLKEDKYQVLRDLVSFNTISDKENKKIIDYLESYLTNLGFKTEYKTKDLVMSIGQKPKLGFLGHTDTVEYIKDFHNPFEVVAKEGYLYGLGVCDMKGGISAMLDALKQIDFHSLKHGLKLYFTYDEEKCFSGIYELLRKKEVFPRIHDFWRAY